MKSNSICIVCSERVRTALDHHGRLVILDTEPVRDGTIWPGSYTKNGMLVVNIALHPSAVPRSEPLRYKLHRHGEE